MSPSNEIDILIVEDNSSDVELTLHVLQKHKLAKKVYVARDGEEALNFIFCRNKFQERSFDSPPRIVLLDLKLPKVNGKEVLKAMREDSRTRSIPVVIFTSSKEERDLIDSYGLGANSYVQKPLNFDEFRDVIRQFGLYWLFMNIPAPANGSSLR
jgi:two-component system, response regulator